MVKLISVVFEVMRKRELFGVWKVVVTGVVEVFFVMVAFVILSPANGKETKDSLVQVCVTAEVQLYGLALNQH